MRLIDADAFKEYITNACEDMKHLFNDGGAVAKLITESFCKDIDEQPTIQPAQPERKRGKWIEVNDAYNRISGRCSACGWQAHMYEDDVVGMPFCPSCGADMRGGSDGQN